MISAEIPSRFRPNLFLGTCSWKYDSWKGLVYDEDKTYGPDEYLRDYARILNSVEIDQWFWSLFPGSVKLPDLRVVQRYAESVPRGFIFTVKAPNSLTLTHFYAREKSEEFRGKPNKFFLNHGLLEEFLARLRPLEDKLGPVMFQFEYLNRQKMPSKEAFFERFGEFIARAPRGYQYAVEIRNPNYLSAAFFDFLKTHNLGFVYLEGYYMPPIGQIFERFSATTAPFSIIRLHGGDRTEIEKETGEDWNRILAPKPEAIRSAVRITRKNARSGILTYVNINNHFEGSAPLTIERFLRALSSES
jgi:uncharacterized protein YecE (DUF72 family)